MVIKLEQGDVHPAKVSRSGGGGGIGSGPLPVEWMDPMSWRLPSGKALAEFALQAGFIAPLLFTGPGLGGIRRISECQPWKAGTKKHGESRHCSDSKGDSPDIFPARLRREA